MRRLLRSVPIVIALALAVLPAATAVAAPSAWERVDVTMHAEQDGSVLLVSGELPDNAKLPADAELSAPAGAEPQWIGEILGGPAAEDPALKYTKTSANGVDVYRFTLTKAKIAQVELPTSGQLFDGTTYTSSVEWTAAQDVPEVRLSVRVPDGAKPVTPPAGAVLMPGSSGYSFYTKTVRNVKAGDKLDLKMAYTAPAAGTAAPAAGAAAAGSSSSDATALAVFIVVIAFAIGAFVLLRKKGGAAAPVEQSSEGNATHAADSTNAESTSADDADETTADSGAMSGNAKRKLVTAAIIGVLILGTAVVGVQTTKPKVTGDAITEVFAQGEACATAKIALAVPAGADAADTARTVFDVLRPIANTATFDAKTSSVSVGFCDSTSSESAIKAAIAPTGLLAGETAAP